MEAKLHTPQVPPGDETQFMHAVFASDEEMLHFYLIMNRFVNPVTYFMESTDLERLEDLRRVLGQHGAFLHPLEKHSFRGIIQLIQGFSLFMMKDTSTKQIRLDKAQEVASHFQFVVQMAAGVASARQMARGIHSHIQNVEYLIGKMKDENQDSSCSEGDTCKE